MAWLLIQFVKGYQFLLSPWVGNQCRFTPTCSQYTIEALREYGALKGTWMAICRLARCNPWSKGGHDPVRKHKHHDC